MSRHTMTKHRASLSAVAALTLLIAAGCHKKAAPPPPPPPAPAPAPAANKPTVNFFNAEPTTVNSGQASSLSWSVTDATSVEIDNSIGQVSPNGRRAVYPTATTTYILTATGPGGATTAQTTISVSSPPPPPPAPTANQPSAADILAKQVQDLHFDYDKSEVRAQDQPRSAAGRHRSEADTFASIPTSWSRLKAIAMSGARPSTTWGWETGAPLPRRTPWSHWVFPERS